MTAVVALAGILPLSSAEVARRWSPSADTTGLAVPVGLGRNGTVHVDIERDGPHLLVAGTTGSGKSEFLRTMVAALAASYPPDRINLLFVDFKGGSGLGPLTGLPHCVGMLSDLGLQEIDRTLVSLRAEVRRREELLASARARDLTAYRAQDRGLPALPHLIIVIDEFRMLVDEAPRALTELMRIAAIGRSLGLHLIMATQRPQGSITADIRANVTSRVVLRVQSGMESIDVMNSAHAADIPIATPGRAFLVKGAEAPQEFQSATLTPDRSPPVGRTVTVLTAAERLGRPPAEGSEAGEQAARTQAQEAAALADVTRRLWTAGGGTLPRRPVAGTLPAMLPYPPADPAVGPPAAITVRLGWLDMPEQQRLGELCWHPDDHGHLGLVGGAAGTVSGSAAAGGGLSGTAPGGVDAALALVVDQLLAAEHETHLYILDAAGSFSRTVAAPRVGAIAGPHELRRAVRVLERLAGEMIRRLGAPGIPRPRLVLAVGGWGYWVSAFRSGPLARGEDLLQDIVRDGAKAGIAVLIAGERELTTSRIFGGIANRIFFPAGSSDDERIAWPRLPAMEFLPGRVAVQGPFLGTTSALVHVAQLYGPPPRGLQARPRSPVLQAPFRVEALPQRISVSEVLAGLGRPAREETAPGVREQRAHVPLCFGVGGDELGPVSLALRAGSVLAVLGGPGSGKTALLAALPALNSPAGGWLRPAAGTDPADFWAGLHARARAGALNPGAVLLADDIDLQSEDSNRQLLGLNSLGWRVVLTAGFSPALQQRVPLAQCARRQGTGILICPRSLLDGDLFGVRFELEASPPPGRAVLISDGQALAVQLADPAAGSAAPDAAK
jgi:S-DNA-T family DNA segregation ATPase FtsK/SpoIIIE